MTKKEIFAHAKAVFEKYKLPEGAVKELVALLEPKSGGPIIDIDAVTHKDKNGKIIEIQCSTCGTFLPATEEYFYTDKNGKGVAGFKRNSRQADKIKKAFEKRIETSKAAVLSDMIAGVITPAKGKELVEKYDAEEPDYSSVGLITKTETEKEVA